MSQKKTSAAAPSAPATFHEQHSHLFVSRPRQFRIGGDIQPTRDLGRYVKWPRYIRVQRQRAILKQRLKAPPAVNHFTNTLEKASATTLFKLLSKYRPETRQEKRQRLKSIAEKVAAGGQVESKKPKFIKFGLNHVTSLIEKNKAKLVVIAHDVDPIELVVWLPALCRAKNIPYCIVKGMARLGMLVHQKAATALVLTDVRKEDQAALDQLSRSCMEKFNDNGDSWRKWGKHHLGVKATAKINKLERMCRF
jgi:large subunit ribosomal protein L7Ae